MVYPYWDYYLSVENDLLTCSKYIYLSDDNYHTYSIELAKIILLSASKTDVILKNIYIKKYKDVEERNIDMNKYCNMILSFFPNLIEFEFEVSRYGLMFKPWFGIDAGKKLSWWKAYNDIKHDINENLNKATLVNALFSTAAFLSVVLYHLRINRIPLRLNSITRPKLVLPVNAIIHEWEIDLPIPDKIT